MRTTLPIPDSLGKIINMVLNRPQEKHTTGMDKGATRMGPVRGDQRPSHIP